VAIDSVGRPTYQDLFDSISSELVDEEITTHFQPSLCKVWSLEAMQIICERLSVEDKFELLLQPFQEDYPFADVALPVTGTGEVSTSGRELSGSTSAGTGTVSFQGATGTGAGTLFLTELRVGQVIIIGSESKEILEIHSNTELITEDGFSATITSSAFSYSQTRFRRELVVGSVVTIASEQATIESITDARTAVLAEPLGTDASGETFQVDTSVSTIPLRFKNIKSFDRLENGFTRRVACVAISVLIDRKQHDQFPYYTPYNIPLLMAPWSLLTGRYLKSYPLPQAPKSVTIYGDIEILPRSYASAAMSDPIPLSSRYEPAISAFVRSKAYEVLKSDYKMGEILRNRFELAMVSQKQQYTNPTQIQVTYS